MKRDEPQEGRSVHRLTVRDTIHMEEDSASHPFELVRITQTRDCNGDVRHKEGAPDKRRIVRSTKYSRDAPALTTEGATAAGSVRLPAATTSTAGRRLGEVITGQQRERPGCRPGSPDGPPTSSDRLYDRSRGDLGSRLQRDGSGLRGGGTKRCFRKRCGNSATTSSFRDCTSSAMRQDVLAGTERTRGITMKRTTG
jgi:hypothetical protein